MSYASRIRLPERLLPRAKTFYVVSPFYKSLPSSYGVSLREVALPQMRVLLIEDLVTGPVPVGSAMLVEYDPVAQWYAASLTIAFGWIRTGGVVDYSVAAQPPSNIRCQIKRLGLELEAFEKNERLLIYDWYTATLGQKSTQKLRIDSLKVADLSIGFLKVDLRGPPIPDELRILDDASCISRFNDEKAWTEFILTRIIPSSYSLKSTLLFGVIRGVHSEWAYRRIEAAADGVVDFKLHDVDHGAKILMGIRSMRSVPYNSDWHQLRIQPNFEITLET